MPAHEVTKDEILAVIRRHLLDILGKLSPEDVRLDISMRDLGANSIDRVEVILQTMAELSLKIPLVEFGEVSNIGELVDLLYEKAQAR
jgi:polyketide biosynthesis acyl carrier protein